MAKHSESPMIAKEHKGDDGTYGDTENSGDDQQRRFIIGKRIICGCEQIHKGGT